MIINRLYIYIDVFCTSRLHLSALLTWLIAVSCCQTIEYQLQYMTRPEDFPNLKIKTKKTLKT